MYLAELRGKLSSSQERSEDILTSNVFCFFKYAERSVYLKRFLSLVGVGLTDEELQRAEFLFWPIYDDGTEPDVVLMAGDHYLLFEAKYHSGFGTECDERDAQVPRELAAGRADAAGSGKTEFKMIAITDHSCYPTYVIPPAHQDEVSWINWQSVSEILLTALEQDHTPNHAMAQDLYDLLDKKRLRGFVSFERLVGISVPRHREQVFFAAATSTYRGQFVGFRHVLDQTTPFPGRPGTVFYSKEFFLNLPYLDGSGRDTLFYGR